VLSVTIEVNREERFTGYADIHAMKRSIKIAVLLLLIAGVGWANWPIPSSIADGRVDRIVVEKGKRSLTVFSRGQVVREYPISLGRVPVGTKEKEGDKKTPEGKYRIIAHKPDSSHHRALRTSYPEARDIERAKAAGVNPGSDIMIHGIRPWLGFIGRFHRWVDWTAGCIALTNPEIDQIYDAVEDGTVIEIKP
jgi:murein L,D-transpeptidase YafK